MKKCQPSTLALGMVWSRNCLNVLSEWNNIWYGVEGLSVPYGHEILITTDDEALPDSTDTSELIFSSCTDQLCIPIYCKSISLVQ